MSLKGKTDVNGVGEQIKCVDSVTALQLLYLRPTSDRGPICVTVSSKVRAVSEVIQIKDSQLFLVKLLPKLDIICKRKELLHLNDSIIPDNKTYIFTNLRHTTLQKGSSFPRLVYTVTRETRILAEESVNVKMLSSSEWLQAHGLNKEVVPHEVEMDKVLIAYTGIITSILDARLGVFELDRRTRVYIGHIPAVHKYRDLAVGTKITVQNVHQKVSQQHPKVTLFGCMLTSVRIVKYPETEIEIPAIQTPQTLKSYLYLYQLSQEKLQHLYHICKSVQEKFSHLGRRICDKLITEILLIQVLSWHQERDRNYRNHLDEFLHTPHRCGFERETSKRYPDFVSIQNVNHEKNVKVAPSDNQWQYSHRCMDIKQVLLGELGVCEKTGLAVLKDYTGHINTVVTQYSNHLHSTAGIEKQCGKISHECDKECDCDQLKPGQHFRCPYLHTCCLGKIVAVTKYGIICERTSQLDRDNMQLADERKLDSRKYIMLSLIDAIYLGSKKSWTKEDRTHKKDMGKGKCTEGRGEHQPNAVMTRNEGDDKHSGKSKSPNTQTSGKENGGAASANVDHIEGHMEGHMGSHMESRMTNSSQSKIAKLHRHTRPGGGVYFCRQVNCDNAVLGEEITKGSALTDNTESTNKQGNNLTKTDVGHFNRLTETLGNVSLMPLRQTNTVTGKGACSGRSNSANNIFDIPIKKRKTVHHKIVSDQTSCGHALDNTTSKKKSGQCTDNRGKSENANNEPFETEVPHSNTCNGEVGDSGLDDLEFSDVSYEIGLETATVIVQRKDALVMEEHSGNQSARFCVQGQIWRDDRYTQAVLMFKGIASRWHSVIHQGSSYQFSISSELSPLFRNNVGNVKVTQKLNKQNSQMFLVVNELADIVQIYGDQSMGSSGTSNGSLMDPADYPTSVFSGVFKDAQGVIISRSYIKNESLHADKTGKVEQVCTRIKLKCVNDEIMQIYLKPENFASPLGLVPGSVVCFTRLERRVSQLGNIYWRFIPLSSVTVVSAGQALQNGSEQNPFDEYKLTSPTQFLRDVWERKSGYASDVLICVCTVQQIMKVSLKYVCDHCGSMVIKSRCSNVGCFNTEIGRFLARASILVDDGTSVAMVTLIGDMVKDLLLLTQDQWEAMQAKTSTHGEIFVQQTRPDIKTDMEQFLYLLCDNRLVKKTWTMKLKVKPASKYTDLDKMGSDEFGQKTFDTGSSKVTTQCLPFLQLECLQLQNIDPYQLCLTLLAS